MSLHLFRRGTIAAVTLALGMGGCEESDAQKQPYTTGSLDFANVTVYSRGLESPWGLVFLPDGRALVTERPGRLRLVAPTGALSEPIKGVPAVVAQGQHEDLMEDSPIYAEIYNSQLMADAPAEETPEVAAA